MQTHWPPLAWLSFLGLTVRNVSRIWMPRSVTKIRLHIHTHSSWVKSLKSSHSSDTPLLPLPKCQIRPHEGLELLPLREQSSSCWGLAGESQFYSWPPASSRHSLGHVTEEAAELPPSRGNAKALSPTPGHLLQR